MVAVLLVTACSSRPEARAGEPFTLGLGELVRAAGATVRFLEVASDSRCPVAVTCVWEGDADVRVEVNGESVSLHTAATAQRSAVVAGFTIELLELRPQPAVSPMTSIPYEVDLRLTPPGT